MSLLLSCASPQQVVVVAPLPEAPTRTSWKLGHHVAADQRLRIVGYHLSGSESSTEVQVLDHAGKTPKDCFVIQSVSGRGDLDNKVGKQVQTTFGGRPAIRSGAGAEGSYLMWQLDSSWLEVDCSDVGADRAVDELAAAVELKPTSVPIPLDVELPDRIAVSQIDVRLAAGEPAQGTIYLGATGGEFGPQADLELSVGAVDPQPAPVGEATTVNGRPAVVGSGEEPVIWLREGDRWIYVGVYTSDTGPYPDRSGELPVLRSIAASLKPATDLSDPATWFSADEVFG